MSGFDDGFGCRSEAGDRDGRLLKGGLSASEVGKVSCRRENDKAECGAWGDECFLASGYGRGAGAKGEGKMESGCMLDDGVGG